MSDHQYPSFETFEAQFKSFEELKDGFFQGKGQAFDKASLCQWKIFLEGVIARNAIPYPWVYPWPENAMSALWTLPTWHICLGVSFELRRMSFTAWDINEIETRFEGDFSDEDFARQVDEFFTEISNTKA